jgi:hypothetical protein
MQQSAPTRVIRKAGWMIRELYSRREAQDIPAGYIAEFHVAPDDSSNANEVSFRRLIPILDFVFHWDYALLGRCWDEEIFSDDIWFYNGIIFFEVDDELLFKIDRKASYIGIVHDDGALLVEVEHAGVRQ